MTGVITKLSSVSADVELRRNVERFGPYEEKNIKPSCHDEQEDKYSEFADKKGINLGTLI
jgi:hypothetical protein